MAHFFDHLRYADALNHSEKRASFIGRVLSVADKTALKTFQHRNGRQRGEVKQCLREGVVIRVVKTNPALWDRHRR